MIKFREKKLKFLYIQGFPGYWKGEEGGKGFIYGYLRDSGYEPKMININYEKDNPGIILNKLKKIVKDEKIDVVIGHSTGGLFASMLSGVTRILLNPAFDVGTYLLFKPGIPLEISLILREMKNSIIPDKENTIGIFSKVDKVADSRNDFIKIFGKSRLYEINAPHTPKSGEWNDYITPFIEKKLKISLGRVDKPVYSVPGNEKRTYAIVDGIRLPGLKNFPKLAFKVRLKWLENKGIKFNKVEYEIN